MIGPGDEDALTAAPCGAHRIFSAIITLVVVTNVVARALREFIPRRNARR